MRGTVGCGLNPACSATRGAALRFPNTRGRRVALSGLNGAGLRGGRKRRPSAPGEHDRGFPYIPRITARGPYPVNETQVFGVKMKFVSPASNLQGPVWICLPHSCPYPAKRFAPAASARFMRRISALFAPGAAPSFTTWTATFPPLGILSWPWISVVLYFTPEAVSAANADAGFKSSPRIQAKITNRVMASWASAAVMRQSGHRS